MRARSRNKSKMLAFIAFVVFLFSMFKIWVAFSMSNLLLLENVSILEKSATLSEGSVSIAGNKISSDSVKFHKVGDYITYSAQIKNDKDENYILKSITDDNKNEYISYSYGDYDGVKLKSGEKFDFVFTETYSKEVEDISKRGQNYSVNFYFVLEEDKDNGNGNENGGDGEKGDTVEEKITFNKKPATGDHIWFYVALSVISLIVSLFVFRKTGIKKVKKVGLGLFVLFVGLYFALLPQMAKSLEGQSYNMIIENSSELKDKLVVTYTVDGTVNEKIISYDSKVSIDDPSKEGYTFKGWRTDEGALFDLDTPIKDDINLTAVFEADSYQITYELNGGQAENPSSYTIEDEVHINDPTRTGYTFEGWTGTGLSEKTKNLVIPQGSMGDRAYEANWTVNEYTVVFDANGGSGDMDSATFIYDTAGYLPANTFTKPDNRFKEWNTSSDGSGDSYTDQSYIKNLAAGGEIILYAQWTPSSDWAMFDKGQFVNKTMKQLAGNSGASHTTKDYNIVSIERSADPAPTGATTVSVKSTDSPSPLYMWYDSASGTIYYYSPATYIYLNAYSQNMFGDCYALTNIDYNGFLTDEVTDMSSMFTQATSLAEIDLSSFNTAKVTDMSNMFNNCKSATVINVSKFDTRNVTKMTKMFTSCEKVTDLDLSRFNTSKVTDMEKMFDYLPLVESIDVSGFDTSNVTNMFGMFRDCQSLKSLDISSFNTKKVTTMEEMFGCHWPLRTPTIFAGVSSIIVGPNFSTSKVTNMRRMFYMCKNLKSFNLRSAINQNIFLGFDTSSVTDMEGMFSDCNSLTVLDLSSFNTENVTVMTKMFKAMTKLTTIYASDSFKTSSVAQGKGSSVFEGDECLVGGEGTACDGVHNINYDYARIDGGVSSPGYFTRKQ